MNETSFCNREKKITRKKHLHNWNFFSTTKKNSDYHRSSFSNLKIIIISNKQTTTNKKLIGCYNYLYHSF